MTMDGTNRYASLAYEDTSRGDPVEASKEKCSWIINSTMSVVFSQLLNVPY
jgi:hypothetical protein